MERKKDEQTNLYTYEVRIFLSGYYPNKLDEGFNQTYPDLELLTLNQAGFTVTSNPAEISYDPEKDTGKFQDYLYKLNVEENKSKTDIESYVFFFFLIPMKDDYATWTIIGSTVHFWPLKDRCTVAAKLDADNNVIAGPLTLPFEYVTDPGTYLSDDYFKELIKSIDGISIGYPVTEPHFENLFTIDAKEGEKLLFMQGVTGNSSNTDYPEIYTDRVKVRLDKTTADVFTINKNNIQPIDRYNVNLIPNTTAQNKAAREFLTSLASKGYIISFTDLVDVKNQKARLELKQRYNFLGVDYSFSLYTLSGPYKLDPPTNVTATPVSGYGIQLAWKDQEEDEQGFVVTWHREGEPDQVRKLPGQNITQTTFENLEPEATYYFRVQTYHEKNPGYTVSAYSKEIHCATEMVLPPEITAIRCDIDFITSS